MPDSALCVCVVNLITCIHHEAPASFSSGEQSVLQTQDEAIHPGAVVSGKQRGASRATRRLADFTLRRSIVRNPPTKRLVMKIRGDGCLARGEGGLKRANGRRVKTACSGGRNI